MSLVPTGSAAPPLSGAPAAAQFVATVVGPALQDLEVRAASFVDNRLLAQHQQILQQQQVMQQAQQTQQEFASSLLRAELEGVRAGARSSAAVEAAAAGSQAVDAARALTAASFSAAGAEVASLRRRLATLEAELPARLAALDAATAALQEESAEADGLRRRLAQVEASLAARPAVPLDLRRRLAEVEEAVQHAHRRVDDRPHRESLERASAAAKADATTIWERLSERVGDLDARLEVLQRPSSPVPLPPAVEQVIEGLIHRVATLEGRFSDANPTQAARPRSPPALETLSRRLDREHATHVSTQPLYTAQQVEQSAPPPDPFAHVQLPSTQGWWSVESWPAFAATNGLAALEARVRFELGVVSPDARGARAFGTLWSWATMALDEAGTPLTPASAALGASLLRDVRALQAGWRPADLDKELVQVDFAGDPVGAALARQPARRRGFRQPQQQQLQQHQHQQRGAASKKALNGRGTA